MLLVPAQVRNSPVHGFGLFARERIARGTMVWRFDRLFDLVFDPGVVEEMLPHQRDMVKYYAYLSKETGNYIFSGDDYRFINHSDTPNLDSVTLPESEEPCDVANRDIHEGEELFVNYNSFDAGHL